MNLEELGRYYQLHEHRFLSEWQEFVRFRTISADPACEEQCHSCAEWLCERLSALGCHARLLKCGPKPVVFAEKSGAACGPTLLFYGHYDVQPADPLALWKSLPFEPEVRDGRLYGRGAQDNKGQCFAFIKGLEAVLSANLPHPPIKIIIEGEEEVGSAALSAHANDWRELLKADLLLLHDTGSIKPGAAGITLGLRGVAACELRLAGPHTDLHSGAFGGVVKNPAIEMARLLATLHDHSGRVTVDGFYDAVLEPTDHMRELMSSVSLDEDALSQRIGVALSGGELGRHVLERRGLRPTLDINGMQSGYGGPGLKTIIPSEACAKISMRLVPRQEPCDILCRLEKHLRTHMSPELKLEIISLEMGGAPACADADSPYVHQAVAVLEQVMPQGTHFLWEGGSVPVVPKLVEASGAVPVMVGFGLDIDNMHAPNESYSLAQFRSGFLFAAVFLQRISQAQP